MASPAPATRVVAELTGSGAEQMAGWIGQDAVRIEAEVVEARADEWDLSVLRVDHRTMSIPWNGEVVTFPTSTLRDVRERRLDGIRTAAFVGGVTGVAVALAVSFIRFAGIGDDASGGPPLPPE